MNEKDKVVWYAAVDEWMTSSAGQDLGKFMFEEALTHRDEQIKGLVEALEFVWRGMKSGNIKAQPYLDFSDPNAANLELKSPVALVESALAAYKEIGK